MNFLSSSIAEVSLNLNKGILGATQLTQSIINRQRKLKELNAFITQTEKYALEKAHQSEQRIKCGKSKGILEGIPIAIKDNFCTKGIRTSCGSNMLKNYVPPYNATVVQRLENAGAVLIGKTNMDEFGMGSGTIDSIFGPTQNIYGSTVNYTLGNQCEISLNSKENEDDWYIAGGSSGGSAVAVASGMAFAALGSDTGGSVRNPASYCGVVGFKPSYGTISRHGLISLVNSLDVPGILARTVDDVSAVFSTIAGPDQNDSTSDRNFKVNSENLRTLDSIKDIKIGIPREYHCEGMDQEIVDTWTHITQLFQDAGAKILEVSLPHTEHSITCYSILNPCEVASNFTRYNGLEYGHQVLDPKSMEATFAQSRAAGLSPVVRGRILAGNYFLLNRNIEKYYKKALKTRYLITKDFHDVWDKGVDFILSPTTLSTAMKYSEFKKEDNRTQTAIQDFCTQAANIAGVCAITLPIQYSPKQLPISLQLMAPRFNDNELLSITKWLESMVQFKLLNVIE